jgi:hypothetical protein
MKEKSDMTHIDTSREAVEALMLSAREDGYMTYRGTSQKMSAALAALLDRAEKAEAELDALKAEKDAKGVEDAIAECQRYLDYLDAAERRSRQLQEIAGQARRNEITRDEARRMADKASGPGVTVYDGAKLADAIKTLMVAATPAPGEHP